VSTNQDCEVMQDIGHGTVVRFLYVSSGGIMWKPYTLNMHNVSVYKPCYQCRDRKIMCSEMYLPAYTPSQRVQFESYQIEPSIDTFG